MSAKREAIRGYCALLGINDLREAPKVRHVGSFEAAARVRRTWSALFDTAIDTFAASRANAGPKEDRIMDEALSDQRWMALELGALAVDLTTDPILYERGGA